MAGSGKDNHDTKPIVLVDGSSYLFRAYYAMPDLTSSEGAPTGAVRGVISMIRRLSADYPGSLLVVVFDAPGKTFRDAYQEIKRNLDSVDTEDALDNITEKTHLGATGNLGLDVLEKRLQPHDTGHINTAISVLKDRVQEVKEKIDGSK